MARAIKNAGPTKRRVDSGTIAKALGAKKAGAAIDRRRGPVTLFALRRFLADRLRSSGGRPALTGTTGARKKIPVLAGDWRMLEKIAEYYREKEGINVSPGQVASALIHTNLSGIDVSRIESLLGDSVDAPGT